MWWESAAILLSGVLLTNVVFWTAKVLFYSGRFSQATVVNEIVAVDVGRIWIFAMLLWLGTAFISRVLIVISAGGLYSAYLHMASRVTTFYAGQTWMFALGNMSQIVGMFIITWLLMRREALTTKCLKVGAVSFLVLVPILAIGARSKSLEVILSTMLAMLMVRRKAFAIGPVLLAAAIGVAVMVVGWSIREVAQYYIGSKAGRPDMDTLDVILGAYPVSDMFYAVFSFVQRHGLERWNIIHDYLRTFCA